MHHELVLIDQPQLRQRQRELHACHEQSLSRLLLELLNGRPQIPAHKLRVPVDPIQGARHDVLLRRVDRPGEGFHPGLHPIRHSSRPRRRPPRRLHDSVSHPAKEEGIGPGEVLDRVAMQVFVPGNCTMIAAPVQCYIDGIPKGSHYVLLKRANAGIQRRDSASERNEHALNFLCNHLFADILIRLFRSSNIEDVRNRYSGKKLRCSHNVIWNMNQKIDQ